MCTEGRHSRVRKSENTAVVREIAPNDLKTRFETQLKTSVYVGETSAKEGLHYEHTGVSHICTKRRDPHQCKVKSTKTFSMQSPKQVCVPARSSP